MRPSSLWLAALFITTLALGTDEFVIAGVLNMVAADLGVSPGTAGQLVTGFAMAFALGAPLLSLWLDPYPRRMVLSGGLAVFVVANIGCAVAPGLAALMALRIVAGLSAAVVSTTAFAAAAEGAPEGRQGAYLSVVTAGLTVALFTGVPVGAWLAALLSWRMAFVLIAAAGAGAAVIALATMPDLQGGKADTLEERLAPLSNPDVLRMVVATLACGAGGLMFYTYLGPITVHVVGTDAHLPGLLLLIGLTGVGSALLSGRLTDAEGPRRARLSVLGGHVLALGFLAVLVVMGSPPWLFVLGVGLWAVFAWALTPPLQATAISAAPEAAMTAVSLMIGGLYLGTAVGGGVGGILLDRLGVPAVLAAAVIALAVAWLTALPRTRGEKQVSAGEASS